MASSITLLLLISCIGLLSCTSTNAKRSPPVVNGLSYEFYNAKCPNLESIVRNHLQQAFKNDIGLAAGLLRLHFHDCFVQGCDASVLLDGSASGPGEQSAPPNLSLRKTALKAINDIRALIDASCGQIVSCADVVALAARDSVQLSGGPNYRVPLGRRDGLSFATQNATLAGLPSPVSNVTTLLSVFNKINLDTTDLVALSGGHTLGLAHCSSFTNRLYPNQDPNMDKTFANNLKGVCPKSNTSATTVNDIRSPNVFDNKYYVDLLNRQTLFTSDQSLYSDSRTKSIVTSYAIDQSLFFRQFAASMIKMGQLGVITGQNGEIRRNCSARNSGSSGFIGSVIEELEESILSF